MSPRVSLFLTILLAHGGVAAESGLAGGDVLLRIDDEAVGPPCSEIGFHAETEGFAAGRSAR